MTKPQALIDGTVFEGTGRIGIWRLFYEVISRTSREINYTILLNSNAVQPVPAGVAVSRFQRAPDIVSRRHVVWKTVRPFHQSRLRSRFPNHLWHPTFYSLDPRGTQNAHRPPQLVTVYDMLSEDFYWMGDFAAQREMKRRCLAQCDHAIAISSETERSLKRFFPKLDGHTTIIPLAADHTAALNFANDDRSSESNSPAIHQPFCLFVGGRNFYKHFEFVVRAIASPDWPDELRLVVAGSPFEPPELEFMQSHDVGHKIEHVGSVNDHQLCQLYKQASCFLFPSLGEGFGLPVLESQLHDTVPILSDIPVFREVGGSGAVYYAPHDTDALIASVRTAMSPPERSVLLKSASDNVERFSWDSAAAQTVACYETALRNSEKRSRP